MADLLQAAFPSEYAYRRPGLRYSSSRSRHQRRTHTARRILPDRGEARVDDLEILREVTGFKRNRVYLPEVVIAARAMKAGMTILNPLLSAAGESSSLGTLVMGTVKGDLHDIGKNLVLMMAEGAGFKCVNLGTNTSSDKFIEAVKENNATILGMSALLTTTMIYMKTVIRDMEAAGLGHVKICVGGAPLNQMFADEIGADGYAGDAASAVDLFKSLAGAEKSSVPAA